MKEKLAVGLPLFPSDRNPKATKDVNVPILLHSSNFYKLHQWISGTFWSCYLHIYFVHFFCMWISIEWNIKFR